MNRKSALAAGAFLVVFLLGGLTGSGVQRYIDRRRHFLGGVAPQDAKREQFLLPIDTFVHPSPAERVALARIYDENLPESTVLLREIEPRYKPLRDKMHAEMRAALSPDERPMFDKVIEVIEARYAAYIALR